jgi:branched-chain amino acid transport system permease protein
MSEPAVLSIQRNDGTGAKPWRFAGVLPIAFVAAIVLLAFLPWYADFATQRLLVEVFTLFAIAFAWNLLAGYGGMVAIGQHVFVGIGSYSLFAISDAFHLNPWLVLPIATLCSATAALLFAGPMFRLSGAYFAVGTWVLAEMARIAALNTDWLGAGAGMPLEMIGEFDRWSRNAYVYWAALVVGVGAFAIGAGVLRSRVGLALISVRDSEAAALACGVPATLAKLSLWVIAAAITGTAGAVSYMSTLQVTPDASFSLNWTASAIFIVVLGGIGTIEGPVIGTIVYFALRETFADFGAWYFVGLGALAVATMIVAPGGAWGLLARYVNIDPFGIRRRMPGDRSGNHPIPQTKQERL